MRALAPWREGHAAVELLARRGLRTHRRAWLACFSAIALISMLLGSIGLTAGSALLAHSDVSRYAAAPVLVTGNQSTQLTVKSFGDTTTVKAPLTQRVGVPTSTVGTLRSVPGVRQVVSDDIVTINGVRADGVGRSHIGRTTTGRSWQAAGLAPYALESGRAPHSAQEVVAGHGLHLRVGQHVTTGAGDRFEVVGVANGPSALYFTTSRIRSLAGHPSSVDVIGVLPASGVSDTELTSRVKQVLASAHLQDAGAHSRAHGDSADLQVLTGHKRGDAQYLSASTVPRQVLELLGASGGVVLLIALLVLTTIITQALQQREAELGLLRTIGMTPRQVRASVGTEVMRVGVAAGLVGAVAAIPAFLGLRILLRSRGILPPGLTLPTPPWLFPGVVLTAALTVAAAVAVVPFACGRTQRRTGESGKKRRTTGLVLLITGISAAAGATLQGGDGALAAASTAAFTMVTACAVLGPWIARGALRLLSAPMQSSGPSGHLAAAMSSRNTRRLGAAITPVVLVIAFAAVQLAGATTVAHAAEIQARQATSATVAVSGGGVTAQQVSKVPGVTAATDILHGTLIIAHTTLGDPTLDRLPVLGVTPSGLHDTLDPEVVAGSTARLTQPGTIAVGKSRASGLDAKIGSQVTVRFDDGAERSLRVVAIYQRALAVGDFLIDEHALAQHMPSASPAEVLVSTRPGMGPHVAAALAHREGGAVVSSNPDPVHVTTEGDRLSSTLSTALVAALAALTVLAVLSTLSVITIGRFPEIALLRRIGAGREQIRRMLRIEAGAVIATGIAVGCAVAAVPLLAFSTSITHSLPYVPPVELLLILVVPVLTGFAGVLIPARRALRR